MALNTARKQADVARRGAPPKQRSLVWLQGLLCGAVVTLATPTALLLGVLLGPALLAFMVDRQPRRPRARSIALWNMAAAVDPLRTLWVSGHAMAGAVSLVGDMHIVVTAWSAAAAGWLLAELAPVGARVALEALSISRAARLRAARAVLAEDWGLEPGVRTH